LNEDLKPDADGFLGKGSIVVSQIEVHGPSQCAVPDTSHALPGPAPHLGRRPPSCAISRKSNEYVTEALGKPKRISVTMPDYDQIGYMEKRPTVQELYFPTWKVERGPSPGPEAGVSRLSKASTASEPVVDKWTFSTNLVATTGRHGIPAIGFGPGDEDQAHAPNEKCRIEDLVICSAFYAALVGAL
jgi:hypothetical protein